MKVNQVILSHVFHQAWNIGSTLNENEWTKKMNPARGQSAATALVLLDELDRVGASGEILEVTVHSPNKGVDEELHYQVVSDGKIIDPTWEEYKKNPIWGNPAKSIGTRIIDRNELMVQPGVAKAYGYLRTSVDNEILGREDKRSLGELGFTL